MFEKCRRLGVIRLPQYTHHPIALPMSIINENIDNVLIINENVDNVLIAADS